MDFYKGVDDFVKRFKECDKHLIKIVSHLDCDGISAASILIKTFHRARLRFSCMIIKQLTRGIIDELGNDESDTIIFSDLGSGSLDDIKTLKKNVFILDHHLINGMHEGMNFINPQLYGLGYYELSGAGLAYLFSKAFDKGNVDLAYLGVIGAVGDVQENKGFIGLNNDILNDAAGRIDVKPGLRMFGMQTKPLHKVLEYSTDPYIPGVTGSEQGALMFLKEIDVSYDGRRRLIDLTDEETKKIVTGVILKRMGSEKDPEDVLGSVYLLKDEENGLPTRDAREFSTLLNACGRCHKPSIGIGVCLNIQRYKELAMELLKDYKMQLINSLNWFHESRGTEDVIECSRVLIINAKENVKDTLIGTLAGMVAKSNLYSNGTVILAMANTADDNIKVSLRVCGKANDDIDLREMLMEITKDLKVEIGGHKHAAGCLINANDERRFIGSSMNVLNRQDGVNRI